MSRPKSKTQLAIDARYAFVVACDKVLEIVGVETIEPLPECLIAKGRLTEVEIAICVHGGRYALSLDGARLRIHPCAEWIACQFDGAPRGLVLSVARFARASLNPHSFKWNWHFGQGAGERQAIEFGLALCSLMSVARAAPIVERLRAMTDHA